MREKTVVFVPDTKIVELFYGGFTKKQLEKHVASSEGLTQVEARKRVELVLYEDYMQQIKTSPRNGNSSRGQIQNVYFEDSRR